MTLSLHHTAAPDRANIPHPPTHPIRLGPPPNYRTTQTHKDTNTNANTNVNANTNANTQAHICMHTHAHTHTHTPIDPEAELPAQATDLSMVQRRSPASSGCRNAARKPFGVQLGLNAWLIGSKNFPWPLIPVSEEAATRRQGMLSDMTYAGSCRNVAVGIQPPLKPPQSCQMRQSSASP